MQLKDLQRNSGGAKNFGDCGNVVWVHTSPAVGSPRGAGACSEVSMFVLRFFLVWVQGCENMTSIQVLVRRLWSKWEGFYNETEWKENRSMGLTVGWDDLGGLFQSFWFYGKKIKKISLKEINLTYLNCVTKSRVTIFNVIREWQRLEGTLADHWDQHPC